MKNILELLNKKEFEQAEKEIDALLKGQAIKEEDRVKYYYLLALINSDYEYKNKNILKAKRYIKLCINSQYVEESYYSLYNRLEDDKVILESVIKRGIKTFPKSALLNLLLFDVVDNEGKQNLLITIQDTPIFTENFVIKYLNYYFQKCQWENIIYLKEHIEKIKIIDYYIFSSLIFVIAIIMTNNDNKDSITESLVMLKSAIELDSDNKLENNAHILLAYCYSLLDDREFFEETIDKLPISIKYMDLENYPFPIEINFYGVYKVVFPKIIKYASYSDKLRNKISGIYALYLYYPYEYSEIIRFKMKNIKDIIACRDDFSSYNDYFKVICNMYIGINDIKHAIETFFSFYEDDYADFKRMPITLSDILESVNVSNIDTLISVFEEFIKKQYVSGDLCEYIISPIINKLYECKKYNIIYEIVKKIGIKQIQEQKKHLPLFEMAYSSRNKDILLSKKIYEMAMDLSKNHCILNNLGTIYEELGYISRASELFNSALDLDNHEEIYINNTNRISKKVVLQNQALSNLEREDLSYIDILLNVYIQRDNLNSISIEKIDLTKFENLSFNELKKYINDFLKKNYLLKNIDKIIVNMSILEYLNKLSENIEKNREYKIISDRINFNSLDAIGYNNNLTKKLNVIKDKQLVKILKRDLKECAITYVSMQYKSTILLGGSIIEAILTNILKSNGITNYTFNNNTKTTNVSLDKMGIDQMLFVANEKQLISSTIYHLNHYVREYRNAIHPAVEIRKNYNINERNATMTWNILKETIINLK